MVAQLLMLFHVRSQGELAIPKADSSAFIERSRRLDRIYSIDADEAPFCADGLCCHGRQGVRMPRPHLSQFALTRSRRLVALYAAHAKVMCQIDHKTWELTSLALLVPHKRSNS